MIKIITLNDDRCWNEKLECEHGLSLYIEYDNKKILFDAGQTDIFEKNARILGVNLDDLDAIVLSHGDYDHGNGLKYLNTKTDLICHPDFMKYRISKRTGSFAGLNQTKEELLERFHLILSKNSYNISENIIFLGEIERKNNFETEDNLPSIDEEGNTYQHLDDSGIVLTTPKGIVVISGCSHSGICNILEHAKKVANSDKVLAVIGGFHLKALNSQTDYTINYFIDNNIEKIYLAHCTSDIVCEEFLRRMPKQVKILSTGECLDINEN